MALDTLAKQINRAHACIPYQLRFIGWQLAADMVKIIWPALTDMTAIAPRATAADDISLNKNDIMPVLGKGQGGRHAGKTAANNRNFAIKITGGCRKFWLVANLGRIDGI